MVVRTLEHGIPSIFDALSDELLSVLEEAEVLVRYRDGELVQPRGDTTGGVRIVRTGAIKAVTVGADGEQVQLGVFGPGQMFGLMTVFAGLPRQYNIHASGPTTVGHIDKLRMEQLTREHPELSLFLLRTLSTQLYAALDFVEHLRRLPVIIHVARLLSTMTKDRGGKVILEVTQSALAETLGVTRVPVGRALERLQEEGLIERAYGRIEVLDASALRNWVKEHLLLPPID